MGYIWKYIKTIEDPEYFYNFGLSGNIRYNTYLLKNCGYNNVTSARTICLEKK